MPTFTDSVELIGAAEASVHKLFEGDERVRGRNSGPQYTKALVEAAKFVADIADGRRPFHHLREAMTTSDFPLLFADILDRQLLANYQATVPRRAYERHCGVVAW